MTKNRDANKNADIASAFSDSVERKVCDDPWKLV
jgi:hypothetical protein